MAIFYFQLRAAPEPDPSQPPAQLPTDQRAARVLERDVIPGNPGAQVQPQLHQGQVGLQKCLAPEIRLDHVRLL